MVSLGSLVFSMKLRKSVVSFLAVVLTIGFSKGW